MKITILDYGAGNLLNIQTFIEHRCGLHSELVEAKNLDIEKVECLLIPGVGHYGVASKNLKRTGANKKIILLNKKKIPIIGICLGAQLLLEGSEEAGEEGTGIGLLEGRCIHLNNYQTYKGKVPRVGWSEIENSEGCFYFVHSYCMTLKNEMVYTVCKCKSDSVVASIRHDNIIAMQFHPEKSGIDGLNVFQEFVKEYA